MLKTDVVVRGRAVTIGDLIASAALPRGAGDEVVAVLPAGVDRVDLSAAAASGLIRRRLPMLAVPVSSRPVTIRLQRLAAAVPAGSRSCWATIRPIEAGQAIARADLAPVACGADQPVASLAYDRAGGVVVATASLPVGADLGAVAPVSDVGLAKGAALTLRSTAGPVVIERQVTTMQVARAGGRVFVRDASGKVFAAPLVLGDER